MDYIATKSGHRFVFGGSGTIDPDDICHALAMLCRYTGHTRTFYSVAEHSVRVRKLLHKRGLPRWVQLQGLLHDASEAYLGDVSTPLKYQLPRYQEMERELMARIMERFGLPVEIHPAVKEADHDMFGVEVRRLFSPIAQELFTLPAPKEDTDEIHASWDWFTAREALDYNIRRLYCPTL